ncbi:hypothetical protein AAEY27_09835 [Kosakonia sp. BYX6]|uniref:Uncharacterized protein n=1 Tax=Kosakonia calanthes TaxID=3139408 RepID=A0ABZ3B9Z2_9ENTR
MYPRPGLEELDRPEVSYAMTHDDYEGRLVFKGVITYIINDARSGESDDNPVM